MTKLTIDPDRRRDVVVAVAFIVLGIALYVGDLRYFFGGEPLVSVVPEWVPYVALALACAFQSLRSTRPDIALGGCLAVMVVDAFAGPTIAVWIVYSDVVYSVARYGSAQTRRAMLLANWLIAAVALTTAIAGSGDWRVALMVMLLVTALIASPASYGHAIRQHQIAADSERARAQATEELAIREQEAAIAQERRQLARDLHDVIAGHLSGIALQTAAALETTDSATRETVLRTVRASSIDALGEMRTMIELLSGSDDLDSPATATMARLDRLIDAARAAGSPVRATIVHPRLAPATDIAAFRIIQQAITNATVHSPRSAIEIDVQQDDSSLTIAVTNPVPDGTTAAVSDAGHGITNMKMRASSVGGVLEVSVAQGRWRVFAQLPTIVLDTTADISTTSAGSR